MCTSQGVHTGKGLKSDAQLRTLALWAKQELKGRAGSVKAERVSPQPRGLQCLACPPWWPQIISLHVWGPMSSGLMHKYRPCPLVTFTELHGSCRATGTGGGG